MNICLLVLKKSNKSRLDSYCRPEQCIDHIPYCHSGLSRAHFFPTTFLEIAVSSVLFGSSLGIPQLFVKLISSVF